MEEEPLQPEEESAEYEMREVQSTGHIHEFRPDGTDSQGWEIWRCPCGAGYGRPPS